MYIGIQGGCSDCMFNSSKPKENGQKSGFSRENDLNQTCHSYPYFDNDFSDLNIKPFQIKPKLSEKKPIPKKHLNKNPGKTERESKHVAYIFHSTPLST